MEERLIETKRNSAERNPRRDVELAANKTPYPKSVFLILGQEFCERYSYYGMKAILALYLTNSLQFDQETATSIYHGFGMIAYFTPLLGAWLADSLLGRFRTIFYLSVVYAIGNIVLSLAATPPVHLPAMPISMVGLLLIAIGTGGIKPCVSSFGADQFKLPEQEKQMESFFSIFYFSINSGSLLSMFITPILRKDVQCFGNDCYSLAFSVPAALMISSLILFLIGKRFYTIRQPQGDVIIPFVRTIGHALSRKIKSEDTKEHWMDYADDKYSKRDIENYKIVLRVLFLFLPVPLFWTLFDQMGSTWTFQASRMNGDIGDFVLQPDQMQALDSVLVLLLIPVFDRGIYPLLGKCGLIKKPLQRMTVGGIFVGIAFVASGLLELELQKTYPAEIPPNFSNINFINMASIDIHATFIQGPEHNFQKINFTINQGSSNNFGILPNGTYQVQFEGVWVASNQTCQFMLKSEQASTLLIAPGTNNFLEFTFPESANNVSSTFNSEDALKKSSGGNPYVRIIQNGLWLNPLYSPEDEQNATIEHNLALNVTLRGKDNPLFAYQQNLSIYSDWRSTPAQEVQVSEYQVIIGSGKNAVQLPGSFKASLGGSYIITIVNDSSAPAKYRFMASTLVTPNSLHMLWQTPQYVIMVIGEILFSITIMDFSYSQAPQSMKSVMQAAWLMTVTFGDLVVVIISEARVFEKQWKVFFLYAGLMFLDMLIFSFMAYRYVPANLEDVEEDQQEILANEEDDQNNQ